VDEIILFHALEKEQTLAIAKLMLKNVAARLAERDIHLTVTQEAETFLAEEGFDPAYGARPLRRAIQHQVEDTLSEEILAGRIRLGDRVEAFVEEGKLRFRRMEEEQSEA